MWWNQLCSDVTVSYYIFIARGLERIQLDKQESRKSVSLNLIVNDAKIFTSYYA